MQKYHSMHRKFIVGVSTLIGILIPFVAFTSEVLPVKELEHQLGKSIDEMENIIPVVEKSKSISVTLPYFNRYPHFTEQLIGKAVLYFPIIEQILKKHNLPEDLKYIPFFESGFREDAVSPVGATGMWQFMAGTGRKYGLTINSEIDERLDFVKSTEAAALFLKSLHEEFGNWALVLMAYNGGPYRVKKLIRRNKSVDVRVIMDQMPRESQDYLSKMIAAKLIFNTYKLYGLAPSIPDPVKIYNLHTMHVGSVDLGSIGKEYGVDYTALRKANPHLKYRKIRNAGEAPINIRIPVYAKEDGWGHGFRNHTFYISSIHQLEGLAAELGVSVRQIALANEQFNSSLLVGEYISFPVPVEKYMSIDQKFGHQPVYFLTKNLDAIRSRMILSKVLLPVDAIGSPLVNQRIYYLDSKETLLDVVKRLNLSLETIKLLNPELDLYKSNRFYIPVKPSNPILANVM